MILKDKEQNKDDDRDDADRHHLPIEVRFCALLDRSGNLPHPFVPSRRPNHDGNQDKGEDKADYGTTHRQWHAGIEKIESKKHHDFAR